jgi:large subunit ribosomal protein L7A
MENVNNNNVSQLVKSSLKVVGLKQTLRGIIEGKVRCVILARNADDFIKNTIHSHCNNNDVEIIISNEDMKTLGIHCGIEVGASVVGIIKESI